MQVIRFYSVNDAYGAFSNFAAFPIRIDGRRWPTSEHYFQAMKFDAIKDQNEIRRAKTPMQAARMGRDRTRKLKASWESSKDQVMRTALWAKFSQHEQLRQLLLGTGSAKLIEATDDDQYWGEGSDGKGKNRLGRLLMELREQLKTGP